MIFQKHHLAAFSGAQRFLISGALSPLVRYSVTSAAAGATIMAQTRQTFRLTFSRVFSRVN